MTPPVPPDPDPKKSRLDALLDNIFARLAGLALFVGDGYFAFLEVKAPPVLLSHLIFHGVVGLFGLALMFTTPTLTILRAFAGIAGQFFGKKEVAP
jgi:uncharacterized membrane protein